MSRPRKRTGRRDVDMGAEMTRELAEVERRREETVEQQLRGLARSRGWKVTERRER
jgi:hypothetical protein